MIAIMTAMVISIASWPGSFNCRALFFQPGSKNRARRLQVLQGLLPLFGSVVVGVLAGIIDDPIQPAQKIACILIRRRHGTGATGLQTFKLGAIKSGNYLQKALLRRDDRSLEFSRMMLGLVRLAQ